MQHSDYRMGWAPALLCIEDTPSRPVKPSLGYAYRGRTNDPFEVGDFGARLHLMNTGGTSCVREEDCMQGERLARFVKAKPMRYALEHDGCLYDLYLARLVEYHHQLMNSVCRIPTLRDLYEKDRDGHAGVDGASRLQRRQTPRAG